MKKILVPTDFSANANNALKYANSLGESIQSDIVLLNVFTPTVGTYNAISGIIAEETAIGKSQSKGQLNKLCNKYLTVDCTNLVQVGSPVNEILDAIKKTKASMIIMGARGTSGLAHIFFGSNASETILKSTIPVITVPSRYHFKKIATIVYASDLEDVLKELKQIIPIAKKLNATIEILHFDYGLTGHVTEKLELMRNLKLLRYKKITLVEKKATLEETMFTQISKYLKKRKPELMVMFPEKKSWFNNLLVGSKTEEFAAKLTIPLLSIRKPI